MNILKNKRFFIVFLLAFLVFLGIGTCMHVYIYAQEKPKQSEVETLEQVKNLLNEGLGYLQSGIFDQAKSKFEEALKIAPEDMKEEIKSLISRADEIANKRKELSPETTIAKGEEEAKKIAELKQNIIQFEKEQKKKAYIDRGNSYYDKGKYDEALLEFNKILTIEPKDKDAIAYIEKTEDAMKKSKDREDRQEVLTRTGQVREYWGNAKSYYRNKKYDDAIKELKKILAINPTDTEAIKYMGLAEEMKLFGTKMEESERLENMVTKGKEYFRDEEYDKAIEIWEQVLKEKEDYPGIEVLIGQAEFAKIKIERGLTAEKQKVERENKLLKIDEAYVPVVGGVKEEKNGKPVEDETLLAIEELKKKMKEKKVSLEFTDADLRSVVLFLSKQSGINMMIDDAIFETGAVPTTGPGGAPGVGGPAGVGAGGAASTVPVRTYNVTVSLRDIPLLDALSSILRSRGLDYEVHPNLVWISTKDRIENVPLEPLETRVFDIQFGGPIRGQQRPQPMQLETLTFGQTSTSGGSSSGGK